jgi:hypothetical protein
MNIETRQKMLEHTNKLRDIIATLFDCQDIWMSDVKALDAMVDDFKQEFNLVNKQGEYSYYSTLILGDDDDKE